MSAATVGSRMPGAADGPAHASEAGPRPCTFDGAALDHARRLAADWRSTGLHVVLFERQSAASGGCESYELVAESPTTVLCCACRAWRYGGPLFGPIAWTVTVSVRRPGPGPDGPGEVAREVGAAAGASHEAAWRQVLAWIDGAGQLHAGLGEALARVGSPSDQAATPVSRMAASAARGRVPAAAAVAILLAAGLWTGHSILQRSDRARLVRAEEAPAQVPVGTTPPAQPVAGRSAPGNGAPASLPRPVASGVSAGRTDTASGGAETPRAAHEEGVEAGLRAALERSERELGPEHPGTAAALADLAALYADRGRYREAEPLLRRALVVEEGALGPGHPDVALGLTNLAGLYRRQGRFSEAEPLYRRALAILEEVLGPDHPNVGTALHNLGDLYREEGRDAEAEPLLERALAVRGRALGPGDPDVARTRDALASLRLVRDPSGKAAEPARSDPAGPDGAARERAEGGARLLVGGAGGRGPLAGDPARTDAAPGLGLGPAPEAVSPEVTLRPAPPGDRPAPAGPVATPRPRTPSAGPPRGQSSPVGRYTVQVAAVRDPGEVSRAWRWLAQRHPALAGLEPSPPRPVAVPGGGTLYRVAGGAFATESGAHAFCDRLRAGGADCRVAAF